MMDRRKALLLAGTGTLGGAVYPELLGRGYDVAVVSLDGFESVSPRLRFIKASADLALLEKIYAGTPHYDGVIRSAPEPCVIAITGMGPIHYHLTDPSKPGWGGQFVRQPDGWYRDAPAPEGHDPRESVSPGVRSSRRTSPAAWLGHAPMEIPEKALYNPNPATL